MAKLTRIGINATGLKDALYNIHPDAGRSNDISRGVLIGVVSATMAIYCMDFDAAISWLMPYMPSDYDIENIPLTWQKVFKESFWNYRKP
jgi:hypothetical protein